MTLFTNGCTIPINFKPVFKLWSAESGRGRGIRECCKHQKLVNH